MANFNLTKMAVDMFCPGNVVRLDDAGLPSLLVYIPAFKNSEVLTGGDDSIHPAFIVNGVRIPGIYCSKYQNVVYNGKAYSLPGEDPQVNVDFDTAREYCEAKGYGWHISTAAEWAAIALWCKKNGFLPCGNNSNGKDSREETAKAIPTAYNGDGTTARAAVGTGPLTWSHDQTPSGIWDMNGNVWELQSGLRLVWGELHILANNDAADPDNPQNQTSTCWKAINAADGSLVEPECAVSDAAPLMSGQTIRLDYVDGVWTYTTEIANALNAPVSGLFGAMTCAESIGDAAKSLLMSLALLPASDATVDEYEGDSVTLANAIAECILTRGGCYASGEAGGIFSMRAIDRLNGDATVGMRAAYIANI